MTGTLLRDNAPFGRDVEVLEIDLGGWPSFHGADRCEAVVISMDGGFGVRNRLPREPWAGVIGGGVVRHSGVEILVHNVGGFPMHREAVFDNGRRSVLGWRLGGIDALRCGVRGGPVQKINPFVPDCTVVLQDFFAGARCLILCRKIFGLLGNECG